MKRQRAELSPAHHRMVERELQRVLRSLPEGCVDRDDGRSAGYEGLIEAMGRYDPRYGVSFERYARPREGRVARARLIPPCSSRARG